ncbi:hypothetical protein [Roseiconus lacunae]|uniref:Cytochrome C n=1 Tax=Roseiconus lacunae TaxID=2605694 RepID=A0ABT7PKT3_9BACT|nr:hypothetical protein [Roseiconus lacunae]MCD0460997.1 hypothetical protein [Roseiconus lacunae]MDM4016901.1 hypothetical protein [Roseiconus lacunae]WRQ48837.1 hypothetical protein U8335_17935 [Stieleria sp. HD01]
MVQKSFSLALVAAFASLTVYMPVLAAEESDEPKYTIKQVMKEAFKGPLVKKVVAGDASDEEVKKLHEMMVAMTKNTPKKGDEESWKKLTTALVKAAEAVKEDKEDGVAMLKKASNCKACHSEHK